MISGAFSLKRVSIHFLSYLPRLMKWGLNFSGSSRTMKIEVESVFEITKTSVVESDVLSRLASFQKRILDRILLSEAQVERVFSRHKAIHTTMWASLSPDIVENVLYIRYNGKMCGLWSVADEEGKIVDEENCFMPLFVE